MITTMYVLWYSSNDPLASIVTLCSPGKKIVAQFIAETTYHIKFPASLAAVVPLKPSS